MKKKVKTKKKVLYKIETTIGKNDYFLWSLLAAITDELIWEGEDAWFTRKEL